MRRWPLSALLFASLLVVFAACSSSDDDDDDGGTGPGNGHPPAAMIDTWIYASVTVDGAAAVLATVLDWDPLAVEARLHVYDTSAFVYEEVTDRGGQLWAESGFVFIDGSELDVNVQADTNGTRDERRRFAWDLTADTLTLTSVGAGSVVVFRLTRSAG